MAAYREVGSFRGAAAVCGTTDKTVKRVLARHEAGRDDAPPRPRERNYDGVVALVEERVAKTKGRISAKRLLPAGTLLVVHHADVDTEQAEAHGFDPADYVSPADVAALLDERWRVEVDERRPRHIDGGAEAHHTHDLVLRALRLG